MSLDQNRSKRKQRRWIAAGILVACAAAGPGSAAPFAGETPPNSRPKESQHSLPVIRFNIEPHSLEDLLSAFEEATVSPDASSSSRIRTDLSATLFFTPFDSCDGGELLVEDTCGIQSGVKLPTRHMALYPYASPHQVTPGTRGSRTAVQRRSCDAPGHQSAAQPTGVYRNRVRMRAEL